MKILSLALLVFLASMGTVYAQVAQYICVPITTNTTGVSVTSCVPVGTNNPFPTQAQ